MYQCGHKYQCSDFHFGLYSTTLHEMSTPSTEQSPSVHFYVIFTPPSISSLYCPPLSVNRTQKPAYDCVWVFFLYTHLVDKSVGRAPGTCPGYLISLVVTCISNLPSPLHPKQTSYLTVYSCPHESKNTFLLGPIGSKS